MNLIMRNAHENRPLYLLHDGRLFDTVGQVQFEDADYFPDVEAAKRWLDENQIDAEVIEA